VTKYSGARSLNRWQEEARNNRIETAVEGKVRKLEVREEVTTIERSPRNLSSRCDCCEQCGAFEVTLGGNRFLILEFVSPLTTDTGLATSVRSNSVSWA